MSAIMNNAPNLIQIIVIQSIFDIPSIIFLEVGLLSPNYQGLFQISQVMKKSQNGEIFINNDEILLKLRFPSHFLTLLALHYSRNAIQSRIPINT